MFIFLGVLLSAIVGGFGGYFFGWEGFLFTVPVSIFIGAGAGILQQRFG